MLRNNFDVGRIYWHEWTPTKILEVISKIQDKQVQVIILPTSRETCDFIIRDIPQLKLRVSQDALSDSEKMKSTKGGQECYQGMK